MVSKSTIDKRVEPLIYHRSRERIASMGEVFTPKLHARTMTSLVSDSDWERDAVIFFEPNVGHGNLVTEIFEKRFCALLNRYKREGGKYGEYAAVAVAIDSIWGVDICARNIIETRARLFHAVIQKVAASEHLKEKKKQDYLVHIACALVWQIYESDAISSLSDRSEASLTRSGSEWIRNNKYRELDFDLSWAEMCRRQGSRTIVSAMMEAAQKALANVRSRTSANSYSFSFIKKSQYTTTDSLYEFEVARRKTGSRKI